MALASGNGTGGVQRLVRTLAAGLALLALVACAPVYRNHGYTPSDVELSLIEVGVDTRETVAAVVGRPSAAALLNDTGWYYVQSRWKHAGGRAPQEIDRQVVAISFDTEGVVTNVERFGLENGQVIALSRRVTETNIRGVSFIGQLLSNLGQLRAADVIE